MKTFVCRSIAAASLALVSALFVPAVSYAQSVDPLGDFLTTYTAGAKTGDLDVLTADVLFTGQNFLLSSTFAADIVPTSGATYVWGFDRGAGTARFSPLLANTENIKFDAVVTLRPDTTATITRIGGTTTQLAAGSVLINGNKMTATIAASELPTTGLSFDKYTFNLWPRLGAGNNNQISDFAPNNTNIQVAAAPEPGSLTLFALASTAPVIGLLTRRRARQTCAVLQ